MYKYTTKFVERWIKQHKGKVPKNWRYGGVLTPIPIKCKVCGHKWTPSWNVLQKGHWCPKCAKCFISEEDVRKTIYEKGGIVAKEWRYKGSSKRIPITCRVCKHNWNPTWGNIRTGYWCPECAKRKNNEKIRKWEEKRISKLVKRKGGVLRKGWHYEGQTSKIPIRCKKCGYIWTPSAVNLINAKSWCPYCSSSKSEKEFRKVIEKYFGASFPKKHPSWLRNGDGRTGLELDGYNRKLKVAFEYQGIQHYKRCYLNHWSKDELSAIKKRDKKKARICNKRDILLIVVPYWIKDNNSKTYRGEWKKIIEGSDIRRQRVF